ncbi:Zn-ribbon domain-containing OB-fold protein [Rhodococcus jostii]|uniref:Zn-ribbon domain-containing OB-fold protein n=1 Tax=Rhodococcus jostii TaxID=132919 RepID=UPI0036635EE5
MTFPAVRDETSAPYFEALREGRLILRSCTRCGHVCRPDTLSCSSCHSDELTWVGSTGDGVVVSAVVDHASAPEPTVLALVELREGPWFASRILDVATASDVPVSTPVRLRITEFADGEAIPTFVLAT